MSIRNVKPKLIDYRKDENFKCLVSDVKLIHNLLEQRQRGCNYTTDFIQPGILSGQSLDSVLRETIKSITNHLDYFEKNDFVLL